MEDAFYWFAYNFGDMNKFVRAHLVGIDAAVFDSLISVLVQFVYLWRIWKLSKWRAIPIITAGVGLLQWFRDQYLKINATDCSRILCWWTHGWYHRKLKRLYNQ